MPAPGAVNCLPTALPPRLTPPPVATNHATLLRFHRPYVSVSNVRTPFDTTQHRRQQVAALTVRIDALHPLVNSTARMDFSCKRGYVKLLARRRKMLAYLKRKDFEIYRKVALETGLR